MMPNVRKERISWMKELRKGFHILNVKRIQVWQNIDLVFYARLSGAKW